MAFTSYDGGGHDGRPPDGDPARDPRGRDGDDDRNRDPDGVPAEAVEGTPLRSTAADGLKIVIVGGFGAGKTTLVGAVSEIRPLSTEETMSAAAIGLDNPDGIGLKSRTTVAFDFGRITLDDEMVLYLFGAPGQERFWFLWDRLFSGTLGAVVLVDTRRIADCWYAIDRLEQHGLPFVVARNNFTEPDHSLAELRHALSLPDHVPMVDCDARSRPSVKGVLITLVDHLHALSAAVESREEREDREGRESPEGREPRPAPQTGQAGQARQTRETTP